MGERREAGPHKKVGTKGCANWPNQLANKNACARKNCLKHNRNSSQFISPNASQTEVRPRGGTTHWWHGRGEPRFGSLFLILFLFAENYVPGCRKFCSPVHFCSWVPKIMFLGAGIYVPRFIFLFLGTENYVPRCPDIVPRSVLCFLGAGDFVPPPLKIVILGTQIRCLRHSRCRRRPPRPGGGVA